MYKKGYLCPPNQQVVMLFAWLFFHKECAEESGCQACLPFQQNNTDDDEYVDGAQLHHY